MMPLTDQYEVLDEKGHATGNIQDGATVHKQGLWHEVVNVWVVNSKGEILMQLRGPHVELAPNVWDVSIGTHLRVNEDPVSAALRAVQTGLGLITAPGDLKHLFNIQCANPMPDGSFHKVLGHIFLIERDLDLSELTYDKEKIAKFMWISPILLMNEIGSTQTKADYFPRANNYYPKLFEAFQSVMTSGN
jgi:isopentenyldiphosphate isomerase